MQFQELKNYVKNKYALQFEELITPQDTFLTVKAPGNPNYFILTKQEDKNIVFFALSYT